MKNREYRLQLDIDHGHYIGDELPTYQIEDVLSSNFDCCSLNEEAPVEAFAGCWGFESD